MRGCECTVYIITYLVDPASLSAVTLGSDRECRADFFPARKVMSVASHGPPAHVLHFYDRCFLLFENLPLQEIPAGVCHLHNFYGF